MINVYTGRHIKKDFILIYDVEIEYDYIVSRNWKQLRSDKVVLAFLKRIDGTTVNDDGALVTPFGTCAMYDCSSGVKVAVVAYYYRNQPHTLVNISECGDNVIDMLTDMDMNFYTYNNSHISVGFTDKKIKFNGETITLREATGRFMDEEYC